MADTLLAKKLGIKPDHTMLVINAPEGYLQSLGTLPNGVAAGTTGTRKFDFVQLFVGSKVDVDKHAQGAIDSVKPGGLLWFSYPKKSSAIKTDVTRDIGGEEVAKARWRPVTQIAIDETWSALRFRPVGDVKPRKKP